MQSRNHYHSGAQGVIELEGSSVARVAVEWVAQPAGCWFKWLNRRSQRARLDWERFEDLSRDLPLPNARIVVNIWR